MFFCIRILDIARIIRKNVFLQTVLRTISTKKLFFNFQSINTGPRRLKFQQLSKYPVWTSKIMFRNPGYLIWVWFDLVINMFRWSFTSTRFKGFWFLSLRWLLYDENIYSGLIKIEYKIPCFVNDILKQKLSQVSTRHFSDIE